LAAAAEAVAAEVDAFLRGTSKNLEVPKDSSSSSLCFLFPWAVAPCEVADGGEGLGDPVLSKPLTSSPSRLSSASGASFYLKQIFGVIHHPLVTEEWKKGRCVSTKKRQVEKFSANMRRKNWKGTTLQFPRHTLGKDLLAEYGNARHGGITSFFVSLVKEQTYFWTTSSGTSSSKVLDLSVVPE
jgi:hypothetical protein